MKQKKSKKTLKTEPAQSVATNEQQTQANAVLAACRDSVLCYARLLRQDYKIPKHIKRIADLLELVECGKIRRLIITIPPRHGKSMLVSQFFPAWWLGRNPNKYIITSTYGQDLSDDMGRAVRDHINNRYHKAVFKGSQLRTDTQSASHLRLTAGGEYFAVGVGGATTGRGAHLLLIDDPIKDREQADSEVYRRRLVDWYSNVAYPRLMPAGAVVICMTRWHEEDLVGVLREQTHEGWHVVDLPALGDDGQALWPQAYPVDELKRIKQAMALSGDEYSWHALYQQNPVPRGGAFFKAEWIQSGSLAAGEQHGFTCIGVDPAISERDNADEFAATLVGVDYSRPFKCYELQTTHGHYDVNEQINIIMRLYASVMPRPRWIAIESNAYQAALGQLLMRKGLPVLPMPSLKDKIFRANEVVPLFAQGRVFTNTLALREQMIRFRGKTEKNDLVDAFILALRVILLNSAENLEKKVDRYAGLSPQQVLRKKSVELELERYGGGQTGLGTEWAEFQELEKF